MRVGQQQGIEYRYTLYTAITVSRLHASGTTVGNRVEPHVKYWYCGFTVLNLGTPGEKEEKIDEAYRITLVLPDC